MQETIVTSLLRRAADAEGSTQALATRLHAPETTLLRWMEGRAKTPLRVFLTLVDYLMELERKAERLPTRSLPPGQPTLSIEFGPFLARCATCGGTDFKPAEGGALRLTARLNCAQCHLEVVYGTLLAVLATEAVRGSRTHPAQLTGNPTHSCITAPSEQ